MCSVKGPYYLCNTLFYFCNRALTSSLFLCPSLALSLSLSCIRGGVGTGIGLQALRGPLKTLCPLISACFPNKLKKHRESKCVGLDEGREDVASMSV